MTLSEIQYRLGELQTAPTRSLGQNFLHDQNLARWIVSQLDIQPGDHIVEIGPGLGALTEFLCTYDIRLTLIEKDGRLMEYLRAKFCSGTTEVFHMDALDFDLRELWGSGSVKVVGNLPYYISTPLIEKFTSPLSPASILVLTLQLELVRRLNAVPGTKEYGALTICVNRRWITSFLRKLPASVFFPVPKVDSAVIRLEKRKKENVCALDEELFEKLVRRGFSERRKQLRNLLPAFRGRWPVLAAKLRVPETVRAEDLSLSQWEKLACLCGPSTAQRSEELFDVVDENDHVVGTESRDFVHVNNLPHRAVHILLSNSAGHLFLQKRALWKDRNPGLWDSSASGHVDSGEDYLEAAQRELGEELGVGPLNLTPIGRLTPCAETGWEFITIYRGVCEGPFHPAPMEVETGAFFPLQKIISWISRCPADFSPVFLQCFALSRKQVLLDK